MNKYGNSSWRKLCFFCYQNANHEMLCKSQHCLSYAEKCEEVLYLKCNEMKARLWFNGSGLHAVDVTEHGRCHFCTMLPLRISYILHKELSISKCVNVSNLRYLYTQVIRKQQSPSLWIDTGFDWNLGSFLSWRSDDLMKGLISAFIEKICHIYFVSISAIIVGPCHGKLFASGGNGDYAIFCNIT